MRVLLISLSTVAVVLIALFLTRVWGLTMPYQRFEAEFLKTPQPQFYVIVDHLEDAHHLQTLKADVGFWLDVHQTSDGQLLIVNDEDLSQSLVEKSFSKEIWKGSQFTHYSLSELRIAFPNAPLLADFLKSFPKAKLILNVADNVESIDDNVVKVVNDAKAGGRVLIQSDAESLMKTIKEKQPLWVFGTSRGDLMRLLSFESVWLESASPFFGDIFISPVVLHGRDVLNHDVISEIHRRKKDVDLGPLVNSTEYDAARHESPEAFILASPTLAESLFAKP